MVTAEVKLQSTAENATQSYDASTCTTENQNNITWNTLKNWNTSGSTQDAKPMQCKVKTIWLKVQMCRPALLQNLEAEM